MKREVLHPQDRTAWLELRKSDLTSTMMPALFDKSPYMTKFELYHAKKSGVELEFTANERTEKGLRIEQYAASEVALQQGWRVEPFKDYIRIPELKLGSSFDFKVTKSDGDVGILEIKAVDHFRHRGWEDGALPPHFEIQLQHQMLCSGLSWAYLAAFSGIYDFTLYFRQADDMMQKALVKAAQMFWRDVEDGHEPDIDPYRDGDVLDALYKNLSDNVIDKTGDNHFNSLILSLKEHREKKAYHEKEADAIKAQLFEMIGDAKGAKSETYTLSCGRTKDSEGKLVTQEMVGTYVGGRSGYRQCNVKENAK